MIEIVNLTPHPVTIIRDCPDPHGSPSDRVTQRIVFPPCDPSRLPRAIETPWNGGLDLIHDDSQGTYVTMSALSATGLVDKIGYSGVENLPSISDAEVHHDGIRVAYIVSIVTAIGALVAGRPTCDLLVPMGQVRDEGGRIIGATSLGAVDVLLDPMARALRSRWGPRSK